MIKKYVLFLALGLTLSGNVSAIPPEEFESFLDHAQKHYPVLKDLRIEKNFKESATKFLKESPEKESEEILNSCIQKNIRTYIDRMGSVFYFELVEGLDPVFRDLNRNCGTSGNRRPVMGIFASSTK